jgi:hypothetical protein
MPRIHIKLILTVLASVLITFMKSASIQLHSTILENGACCASQDGACREGNGGRYGPGEQCGGRASSISTVFGEHLSVAGNKWSILESTVED